jgi:GNAT superfamily N-acetyltransferase
MFEDLLLRLSRIIEAYEEKGVSAVFRKTLPVKETTIKTRLMLERLKTGFPVRDHRDAECLEIRLEGLDAGELQYEDRNRYIKARNHLLAGHKGIALAKQGKVMGDIWYVANPGGGAGPIHPDLAWLDIELGAEDVYLFDMDLMKEHRGGGAARLLMGGALNRMKEKGYRRAYGYYVSNNIPALWTHRMLGYEELSRVEVKRWLGRCRRVKEEQVAERRNA